jgi:SHAQKYF class myb-like DNA-binding protein
MHDIHAYYLSLEVSGLRVASRHDRLAARFRNAATRLLPHARLAHLPMVQCYCVAVPQDDVHRIDAGAVALPPCACSPIAPPPPPLSRRFNDTKAVGHRIVAQRAGACACGPAMTTGLSLLMHVLSCLRRHQFPAPPQPSPKKNKLSNGKAAASGGGVYAPMPPPTLVPLSAGGEKRKGVPWTEEEHRLFLLGLAKFGKGDWRNIARTYVVSRTPTQVSRVVCALWLDPHTP